MRPVCLYPLPQGECSHSSKHPPGNIWRHSDPVVPVSGILRDMQLHGTVQPLLWMEITLNRVFLPALWVGNELEYSCKVKYSTSANILVSSYIHEQSLGHCHCTDLTAIHVYFPARILSSRQLLALRHAARETSCAPGYQPTAHVVAPGAGPYAGACRVTELMVHVTVFPEAVALTPAMAYLLAEL